MNTYRLLGHTVGTQEAIELAHRLAAWHDAMVVHERRAGRIRRADCDADCPHAEAEALWIDALGVFGDRAHELTLLRSRGSVARRGGGASLEMRV